MLCRTCGKDKELSFDMAADGDVEERRCMCGATTWWVDMTDDGLMEIVDALELVKGRDEG
jgi:hypothetical protein